MKLKFFKILTVIFWVFFGLLAFFDSLKSAFLVLVAFVLGAITGLSFVRYQFEKKIKQNALFNSLGKP
jgi:hypothetical protein